MPSTKSLGVVSSSISYSSAAGKQFVAHVERLEVAVGVFPE